MAPLKSRQTIAAGSRRKVYCFSMMPKPQVKVSPMPSMAVMIQRKPIQTFAREVAKISGKIPFLLQRWNSTRLESRAETERIHAAPMAGITVMVPGAAPGSGWIFAMTQKYGMAIATAMMVRTMVMCKRGKRDPLDVFHAAVLCRLRTVAIRAGVRVAAADSSVRAGRVWRSSLR